MIKNIFFSAAIMLFFVAPAEAQICTPDKTLTTPGLKPSTLPDATEGKPYNQGISVLMFRDTYQVVFGQKIPVKIDSIRVTKVVGFPAGINYTCQYTSCVYLWDTVRCMRIAGTATKAGVYPITIYVRAFAKVSGLPRQQDDSIKTYTLTVVSGTASLNNTESGQYKLFPNPADQFITLNGLDAAADIWHVTDMVGRQYSIDMQESNKNAVTFSTANLPAGIYHISNGKNRIRFVLQH